MQNDVSEAEPSLEDYKAGDAFRNTLVSRADGQHNGAWLWHGWAIMDAFLAGAAYARARAQDKDAT